MILSSNEELLYKLSGFLVFLGIFGHWVALQLNAIAIVQSKKLVQKCLVLFSALLASCLNVLNFQ